MKNNFLLWSVHYEDVLNKYYLLFCQLLENYKEEPIEYQEFLIFCYRNTKKCIINKTGYYPKELRAPII